MTGRAAAEPPRLLIRGARVVDPASGRDGVADVRVAGGLIEEIGPDLEPRGGEDVLHLSGVLLVPGLVDPHVHFREPGQERKESIETGAAAAVAGGFTTVLTMPNTDPVVDDPETVRWILERSREADGARVRPIAAATEGSRGERPTDAAALAEAGAVALSDDGRPIPPAILGEVLRRAADAGIPVADHCEDLTLSAGGAILAGPAAERLGLKGIPPEAESAAVERDLEVLARAGGRLHLCHVSTAGSVELLRSAKASGLAVTAETTPHHLLLTTDVVEGIGPDAKMNPPLATEEDRRAVRAALVDGTIDCVATDHAPHTPREKAAGLAAAPFGVVGLETAFGLLYTEMVETGEIDLAELVERMALAPARAFGLDAGRLEPGAPADLAAFAPDEEWTVDPERFRSRSRNTPFAGWRLKG
ncbi:MAG TPA: dihydroorotase, partial [Gemmatimonadota bacterium]|nr:dihydroorotase [Gemmatimonadota bacterium]